MSTKWKLLKTTNNGYSWNHIKCAGYPTVMNISKSGNYWAVGNNGIILQSNDIGNNWQSLSGFSGFQINSMNFSSPDSGWICGPELLGKSTSGGLKWNLITAYPDLNLSNICFIDSKVGFFSVNNILFNAPNFSYIKKTTDGGITWQTRDSIRNSLEKRYFYSIYFPSRTAGYITGGVMQNDWELYGFVNKTTDEGEHWIKIKEDTTCQFNSVFFINNDTGWVGGKRGNTGLLYKTTNGGLTWNTQWPFTTSNYPISIRFVSPDTGWVSGFAGLILKTTDGGDNWIIQKQGGYRFYKIYFLNKLKGYAVSSDTYLETTDGGDDWIEKTIIPKEYPSYFDLFFLNENLGWLINRNGILFTTKEIPSFIDEDNRNEVLNDYRLSQNYPNPFNPSTTITFYLYKRSFVTVKIYNVLGQELLTLVNEEQSAGTHKINFDAQNRMLPSGIYLYRLITADNSETKKMVYVK